MIRKMLAAAVTVVLGATAFAADLKSGPQSGEKVPGPFHPLNVNGENAGKKACLYCSAGDAPVAAVFARTADDANLHKLVAALDTVTDKNAKLEMASFVVFLSAEEKLEAKLKEAADKAKLKKLVLSIESPEGPEKYNISKDADITVLLYKDRVVVANFSFAKGKLTEKDVEKIVADTAKITK